jgi:CheY-like chemotaxis protein
MPLDCLVVTGDPAVLTRIKPIFDMSGALLDFRQDSASAIEFVSRRHLDGVLIDCDDVAGGTELLAKTRNSRANKQTLIFAVTNGSTSLEKAVDLGANFVLNKPIQETRLRSVLDVAIPKMQREHRRYFRYDIDLPMRFRNDFGQCFTAKMKNVSEGGLAIRLPDAVQLKGVVTVEFDLPSVTPQLFHARADVVWSDSYAMGLRFLYVEKDSGLALRGWLNSLEAQSLLRDSAEPPTKYPL